MALTKAHLLVITQDISIKRLTENLMCHQRVLAVITDSPRQAAQFLRNNPLPSIVVLDLALPEMQGIEFLRQLRAREEYAELPVLVLTEIPDPVQVRAALQAGANRYLTKLFAAKNMLSTLDEMLSEPMLPPPSIARSGSASKGGLAH